MSSSSERKKPLQFGPNGCQANVNGEKCGEKRTLGIIDDFKSLYEKKLKEIESYGSGDGNLKAKINLQEQWIKDLQEQNEMMVTAIEELEKEATDRVKMLEDKLDNSSKCICELEDTMKSKDKDLDTLKKCMLDMRKALTEEVANKHDIICALKRDITKLEEQCIQVDKQTAFKDDIIKELRKEIKQLKLGIPCKVKSRKSSSPSKTYMKPSSPPTKDDLENTNKPFKNGPFITINHLSPEQRANSTVIFIHKHSCKDKKDKEILGNEMLNNYESRNIHCSSKRTSDSVFLNKKYEESMKKNIAFKHKPNHEGLHFCKSENDITYQLKPVKEKSKLTSKSNFNKGSSAVVYNTHGNMFEKNPKRVFDVPNHIPVKTYVSNIELRKHEKDSDDSDNSNS